MFTQSFMHWLGHVRFFSPPFPSNSTLFLQFLNISRTICFLFDLFFLIHAPSSLAMTSIYWVYWSIYSANHTLNSIKTRHISFNGLHFSYLPLLSSLFCWVFTWSVKLSLNKILNACAPVHSVTAIKAERKSTSLKCVGFVMHEIPFLISCNYYSNSE